MDRRSTPLDVIEIREPCTADWAAMAGDARSRLCSHCNKTVHNLSAMPRDEAERLMCEAAGRLCIRFERNAEGETVTLDYDRRASGRRRGWRFWTGAGALATVAVAAVNAALGGRAMRVMPVSSMGVAPPAWRTTAPSAATCVMGELPPMTQPTVPDTVAPTAPAALPTTRDASPSATAIPGA